MTFDKRGVGRRAVGRLWATTLCLATVLSAPPALCQEPNRAAGLRIETFTVPRGYAVGVEPVTVVATVRNAGEAAVPAGTARLRFICLGALDYLEGNIAPEVPALEPGAAASFRWRALPVVPDGALLASLTLEAGLGSPMVRVIPINHFATPPRIGSPAAGPAPVAHSGKDGAWLDNGRLRVRVINTVASVPTLFVWVKRATGWQQAATALALAQLESSEGAQVPWWEVFRSESARATNAKQASTLTLTGGVGRRWRATVTLTLRAGSTVLDVGFSASPLRPVRLWAARTGALVPGDGARGFAQSLGPETVGLGQTTAARFGDLTIGATWQTRSPLPGWSAVAASGSLLPEAIELGAEWRAEGGPTAMESGALVKFGGRLLALTPSASVSDARKVTVSGGK